MITDLKHAYFTGKIYSDNCKFFVFMIFDLEIRIAAVNQYTIKFYDLVFYHISTDV